MDNNTLFRELAKHYKFTEGDWWQHRQSGNWILSHSAVLKMSCVPTPEGNTIVLPNMGEYNWLKKGEEGVFGREVVVGGTFRLIDKDRNVIRTVVAWGEANPQNLSKSVSYPNIMAVKRMIDRGVLGVLAFNQLNIYSAVEAETFSDPKQKVQAQVQAQPKPAVTQQEAQPQKAPRPVPQPPKPKAPPMPQVVQAEKKTPEVNGVKSSVSKRNLILSALSDDKGQMITRIAISTATGIEGNQAAEILRELMEEGLVVKEGVRRGTRYGLVGSASSVSFTHEHFNDLWRDTVNSLTRMGLEYTRVGQLTREVTGHDTAVAAFNAGDLSVDKIERIYLLGQNWAASKLGGVQV